MSRSFGSIAKSVRLNKEKYPHLYCSYHNCLWRVTPDKPCPKHPGASPPQRREELSK